MQSDYDRVSVALEYIETNAHDQPDLAEVADHVHLSPHHFQRLFKRWVGISPKRFLQLITIQHAKEALSRSASVLDATFDAGLSSPGRLHDLFVTLDAVTPGEFKSRGQGLEIRTGAHESPFGHCLVAVTDRGVCGLSFHDDPRCAEGIAYLRSQWPAASFGTDRDATELVFHQLFGRPVDRSERQVTLFVKGTNFQVKVWQALLAVRPGQLSTYGHVAEGLGRPGAARAVGGAVGRNPVAWLIPCHRVITSMGVLGNYRWGPVRKKAMIGWEMAQIEMAK